jgi:hypothetical protein
MVRVCIVYKHQSNEKFNNTCQKVYIYTSYILCIQLKVFLHIVPKWFIILFVGFIKVKISVSYQSFYVE